MGLEIDLSADEPKIPEVSNSFGLNLGDYSEPKEVIAAPVETSPIAEQFTTIPPIENGDSPSFAKATEGNWRGDNRYYQSGKKAGQLRPDPKIKATYNHNATSNIPATMLINGALFLSVINFIIPMIIVTVNNYLTPKEKMGVKDLQLTKEEKKEIDPLMDATLKQLNIQANPLILLCITLVSSYAMKFVQKKLDFGSEETETKEEKK